MKFSYKGGVFVEGKRFDKKILVLSLLSGILFFSTRYHEQFLGIGHYDEGITLYGAVNIIQGKLPYRDFYFLYPPGLIYFISIIFNLFGASIVNARIAVLILHSLSVSLAFIISYRIGSVWSGLVVTLLLLMFKTTMLSLVSPLILACCLIYWHYFRTGKLKYLFLSGATAGVVSFFRIDFFIYLTLALILTLLVSRLMVYKERKIQSLRRFLLNTENLLLLLGIIVGLVPMATFIVSAGTDNVFLHLVTYVKGNMEYRAFPFPGLFSTTNQSGGIFHKGYLVQIAQAWPFYLPYIFSGILLFDLFARKKTLLLKKEVFNIRLFLCLCIIFFLFYTRYRPDLSHLLPIYVFVFILFPSTIEGFFHILKKHTVKGLSIVLVWCFIVVNLLLLVQLYIAKVTGYEDKMVTFLDVPKSGGIYISQFIDPDYDMLVKHLPTITSKDDYLFIGSTRHDKIYYNETMLYFLTETKSSTRYWWYDPGIQSSEKIQKEMIEELEASKPKYSVLWTKASEVDEQNKGSISSRVFSLDNYIKQYYFPIKYIGDYIVLQRS